MLKTLLRTLSGLMVLSLAFAPPGLTQPSEEFKALKKEVATHPKVVTARQNYAALLQAMPGATFSPRRTP